MLIISHTTCWFATVTAFNVVGKQSTNDRFQWKNRNDDVNHQFQEFNKQFIGYNENFNVQYRTFRTYFPKILGSFKSLQKRRREDKATVLGVFSKSEWDKLASEKKVEHKLFDCDACMNNPKLKQTLACFFVTTRFQKLAKEKGLSGNSTKKLDWESAKAFGEEHIPTSI